MTWCLGREHQLKGLYYRGASGLTVRRMEAEPPADVLRALGRRIAELRATAGLTQEQFAARLDISLQYIQRIEAGRENLTVRSLLRVSGALGVQLVALFVPPQSAEVRVGRPPSRKPP